MMALHNTRQPLQIEALAPENTRCAAGSTFPQKQQAGDVVPRVGGDAWVRFSVSVYAVTHGKQMKTVGPAIARSLIWLQKEQKWRSAGSVMIRPVESSIRVSSPRTKCA